MKNMSKAQESLQAPPPGWRLSVITEAVAGVSKKSGASMLTLTTEIAEGGEFDGISANDYLITDGSAKGAGIAKKKLRGIATPLVLQALDTDAEIPDHVLAQEMVGVKLFVLYGNEQMMGKANKDDPNAPYDTPLTTTDATTGKTVPLNKLTVQNYSRSAPPAAAGQTNIGQVAPPPAPAQFVPQQAVPTQGQPVFQPQQPYPTQAVQQPYPGQVAAGYGNVPPLQGAPAPQGAFPGFNPAFPQQGFAPPQQGFAPPQNVAQPAWNGGQAVQQPEAPVKAGRGKKNAAGEA